MLVGGALVNAFAFSGSNYLFSMLKSHGIEEERVRHDKAIEQLQAAQAEWARKRTKRLDWINEDLRRQGHALHTFQDVDDAIHEYALVTGKTLPPLSRRPELSDFYTPSSSQRYRELAFVAVGMGAVAVTGYAVTRKMAVDKRP